MTITKEEIVEYETYKSCVSEKCPYEGSPFQSIKQMSSKKKGAWFENTFEEHMIMKGYELRKNYNSGHDRVFVVNRKEVKFEIKGSFLWGENGEGKMRWQQIRPSQDYDMIVFIAVFPNGMEFYYNTKSAISEFVEREDEDGNWPYNQHGGKKVNSGTFFIHGLPEDFTFMIPIERLFND